MQWYKNLKISQKVMAIIAMMIVFIGIVGYTGYYFNSQSVESLTAMYQSKLEGLRSIHEYRANNHASRAALYELMITTDKEKEQTLSKELVSRRAKMKVNIQDYEKTTNTDPKELKDYSKVKAMLDDYYKAIDDSAALALQNQKSLAYSKFRKYQPIEKELVSTWIEIGKYRKASAQQLLSKIKKAEFTANTILIGTILAAIVISGFVGLNTAGMIKRRFVNLESLANRVAEGDFTFTAKIESTDEIGATGTSINNIAINLRKLVQEINKSVEDISAGSEEMSASADQTAQGAQQVAVSVQQLASGSQEQAHSVNKSLENINGMSKAIQKISGNADNTVELSKTTENNATQGHTQAEKAVGKINQIKITATDVSNTINELGKLSSDIEQIVDLIKGIASQTNLLALNAAIEAARAGEHGKGFAVVAEEVKKLAGESAGATDKITGMIKEIQNKTNTAVKTMNEAVEEVSDGVTIVESTGKALGEILKDAKVTSDKIAEISKEVNNLANNSDNVVKMMENISSVTQESSASSEEIASIVEEQTASLQEINASSQTLAKIAENLQHQISVFKV